MSHSFGVLSELQSMLWVVLYLCSPPLLGAMLVGLVVGILQAVTQIQDQSLPMAAKLVMVAAIILLGAPLLVSPLVQQSERLFDNFAALTR